MDVDHDVIVALLMSLTGCGNVVLQMLTVMLIIHS